MICEKVKKESSLLEIKESDLAQFYDLYNLNYNCYLIEDFKLRNIYKVYNNLFINCIKVSEIEYCDDCNLKDGVYLYIDKTEKYREVKVRAIKKVF